MWVGAWVSALWFLSFAQFEKNEQAAKRDCYHGFADAFFSGWFYCCYYYFVGTEFFSLLLLTSKTSNASETYTYQEERGADSLACLSWVSSFLLRGAFFGRLFYFNWQCGFFLALHRHSLWPAWGLRCQANLTCKNLSFCCLFVFHLFLLQVWYI